MLSIRFHLLLAMGVAIPLAAGALVLLGCDLRIGAVVAGVGWQGRHTNLVSREFGSWLFLGTILTTLGVEPPTIDVLDFGIQEGRNGFADGVWG